MPTSLARFARLAPAERALLARLVFLIAAIRLGLWGRGHEPVRRWLRREWVAARFAMDLRSHTPERLAWAVRTASRPVPGASCLTQSLALQFLLARSGRSSSVRIGVARPAGRFAAHAWVECGGQLLLDGPGREAFAEILSWDDR
jgi:hypothetical protein